MLKTIKKFFIKDIDSERATKDLLRENLSLIPVDVFYIDDPRNSIDPDKLSDYDKKFFNIMKDKDIMNRFEYLINKQARISLESSYKTGELNALGGVNINGMATIKDDFQRLANSYLKSLPAQDNFNKYSVF